MIYIYDGTFEGFLTGVFEIYSLKDFKCELISEEHAFQLTFNETFKIITDSVKAERVFNGLYKISPSFAAEIFYIFLADTYNCGTIALNYIICGFKYGKTVYRHINEKEVHDALDLKAKVTGENHRFKGFVRFRKISGSYLADISPDHNILYILYPHFEKRMPDQQWVIRDTKRRVAAVHLDGKTNISIYEDCEIKINDEYEDIWCTFYNSIAIKERLNPKLQRNYVPRRYWKNLVELNNLH